MICSECNSKEATNFDIAAKPLCKSCAKFEKKMNKLDKKIDKAHSIDGDQPESNPFLTIKSAISVIVSLGFLVHYIFGFNPINPCDTCSTVWGISKYEETIGILPLKKHYCKKCAEIRKREIDEQNRENMYKNRSNNYGTSIFD